MNKYFYILFLVFFINCNNEDSNECFKTAGDIIQIEVELPSFDKVVIHEHIQLFVTQGNEQKIIIESGENLLPNISAEIINNELIVRNSTTCNFVRPYDVTKVYVTSPNLTRIRNASELIVSSIGKLTYPSLYLMSLGDEDRFLSVGDWYLTIENESVKIWSNGVANFYISGATTNLDLNFSNGDTRFEGQTFKSNHIKVQQISSNDILVYPIESLTGSIKSTGDIISFNNPPIVEVEELTSYGELLFK